MDNNHERSVSEEKQIPTLRYQNQGVSSLSSLDKSDCIALLCWMLINGYNLWISYTNNYLSGKYFFELAHITSFLIGTIFLLRLVRQYQKHRLIKSAHFSNFISFTFCLSIIVDIMFWTFIFDSNHSAFNPGHSVSHVELINDILMHGLITGVLFLWMLYNEQVPFKQGYMSFNTNECMQRTTAILLVSMPIIMVTLAYMFWTDIGQKILQQPIYKDMVDWDNLRMTLKTFGLTAAGFMTLMAIYWLATWVSTCPRVCRGGDEPQPNTGLEQPSLLDDRSYNAEPHQQYQPKSPLPIISDRGF